MLRDVFGKRVLLLQGPNGPFFMRLAVDLQERGCTITKVNFNSGDDLFYWPFLAGGDLRRFDQPMDAWPEFCRALMDERRIEAVLVYGDQRPIHRAAIAAARERGASVTVFEEGYLRPDHVTVERDGANANSRMPKDADFYRRAAADLAELPRVVPMGNTFRPHAWLTAAHSTAFTWLSFRYPHYRHHRDINCFKEAFFWTRSGVRKLVYERKERGALERLTENGAPPFFLVPLQVYCDAQLQHSKYEDMSAFIEEVVSAFAAHAPRDAHLVIKHHPHDRGYTDYAPLIDRLAQQHAIAERVAYIHDQHLPTLLKRARGVITMNSTVGLSALYHGAPVKVLGSAIYDMEGLTCQKPLAEFLNDPDRVDTALVQDFFCYLRHHNQVNGSFYHRPPGFERCGLDPAAFASPRLALDAGANGSVSK